MNSEGTRHLLQWLGPALRGKRLVYSSTLACVDHPQFGSPINEATECRPRTAYGRTKLEAERAIQDSQRTLGFDYTILRICTIVGAGYRPTGMFGVLPALLARHALRTRLNWPGRISLMGVDDLVRILIALPDFPSTRNEFFVMSNGENPQLDQVLDEMASVIDSPRRKVRLPLWLWRAAGALSWRMTALAALPHTAHTFFWRLSHMICDGVCADASKLDGVLRPTYQPYRECLQMIYGRNQAVEAPRANTLISRPGSPGRTVP